MGACGLVLALAGAFFYGQQVSMQDLALKDELRAVPAKTRQLQDDTTRIQKEAVASPASISDVERDLASLPVVAIPTKRPVQEPFVADKGSKADVALAKVPTGVVRFDRCSPKCETQYPLIDRSALPMPHPENVPLSIRADEQEPSTSALQGAGYILGRAAALPFTSLKVGRYALGKITGLE